MDKQLAALVLGLGILAFVFQLIAFSTQGWFIIGGSYSVTNEQAVDSSNDLLQLLGQLDIYQSGDDKPGRGKGPKPEQTMSFGRPLRPKLADVGTPDDSDKIRSRRYLKGDSVPVPGKIDSNRYHRANADGVPKPDNLDSVASRLPIDNDGVAVPDSPDSAKPSILTTNDGTAMQDKHDTVKSNITIDEDIDIPDNSDTPKSGVLTGNDEVPIKEHSDNDRVSIQDGSDTAKSRILIDNDRIPIPDGSGIPNSRIFLHNGEVPIGNNSDTSNSDTPVNGSDARLPNISDMAKTGIQFKNEGISFPEKPIDNGGVPDKNGTSSRIPIDDGGIPFPGKPDNGGVPEKDGTLSRIPIDDGGIPFPGKPVDNAGAPDKDSTSSRIPIDDGGIPFPGKPDNGGVPEKDGNSSRIPIDDGGIPFPNKQDGNPLPTRKPGGGKVTFPNKPDRKPMPTRKPGGGKVTFPNKPDRQPVPTRKPGGKITFPNKPDGKPMPTRKPGGGKITFPNKPTSRRPYLTGRPRESGGKVTSTDRPGGRPGQTRPNNPSKNASLSQGLSFKWKFTFGLWSSNLCIEKECESASLNSGFLFIQKALPLIASNDVSMSTWNDLRVESVIALISCGLGLVGALLTAKPSCLQARKRLPLIFTICAMTISCILFLVSVSRIASIHINVNEIVDRIQTASQLNTPWSVVLCGIGAGLALASALALCLGTLREERTWKQFDFDVTLTTTDKGEERYADITQMAHENKAYEPGTVENSEV